MRQKNGIKKLGRISKGQCKFNLREVFANVLAEGASVLIVAHNHPNGSLEPCGATRMF